MNLTTEQLAKYLDHTNLQPNATQRDIEQTCMEAIKYNTASVCVNAHWIHLVQKLLAGSSVKPIAVVGFPLGATTTSAKVFEAKEAITAGAQEIDMVINIGELVGGNSQFVESDIKAVAEEVHRENKLLKVIIETSFLNREQIVTACQLAVAAGADYVKTSTGFSSSGAKVEDVALMRQTVGKDLGVKASGGIHSRKEALAMIEAGASRLGVSATVKILTEE
ncbi:deoxyribose-phosphate aldolase [Xylocopilactobacillus apicola]|uniref:Deoxyribose-phosphate aldolase n=1 Tax=Xylocopilactobacillus apicola TaxID=2932184 RepID=A0AAU9D3J5_9LACO|nr:deoxyribose-phosphate aldolase [Xylocopilactobacillus apicola]BDR58003.1 deoxyribose-phosphate aldolase [Xylocopilactobacillus apicola]